MEAAHRAIKRYLKNRLSSLDYLYLQIRENLCKARMVNTSSMWPVKHRGSQVNINAWVYCRTYFTDYTKAFHLIWTLYRLGWVTWRDNPDPNIDAFRDCTKAFTTQWDLPCKHFLHSLLQGDDDREAPPKSLVIDDVDEHWWITLTVVTDLLLIKGGLGK